MLESLMILLIVLIIVDWYVRLSILSRVQREQAKFVACMDKLSAAADAELARYNAEKSARPFSVN